MDELYNGLMVDFYDHYIAESEYRQRATEAISIIKSYNPDAKRLLELACGTGRFTAYLAHAGFVVTASDLSTDEIEKARQKGIRASFSVMDMSKLIATEEYDVIGCFWESFRYLPSYAVCQETIKRIFAALKHNGLFLVDFSHFPPGTKPVTLPPHPVDLGNGFVITQQTTLVTKGDFDTRTDKMRYELNGKEITGTQISWAGTSALLKPSIERGSLLRISREKMEEMLKKAGFKVLEVRDGFTGHKESMLFVVQKKWSD